ncbi:IMP cyclohydrolase [Arcanobacterium hippocoleae]
MTNKSLPEYLGAKTYPGRTLAIAADPAGGSAVIIYFIMGRSANSQNRIFAQDGEIVRTQAFDESKLEDPSLIIYPVYQHLGEHHIVTNGDQTATIYDGLKAGKSAFAALKTRECEPDAPNFTPRISLITAPAGYELHITKAAVTDGTQSVHFNFAYPYVPGAGHCIHTYIDDADPLPSFAGEPVSFAYQQDLGEKVWNAINPDYKISLLECVLDLKTHEMRSIRIFNKHNGE